MGAALGFLVALLSALALALILRRGPPAQLASVWKRLRAHCVQLAFRAKLRTVISWLQVVTQRRLIKS